MKRYSCNNFIFPLTSRVSTDLLSLIHILNRVFVFFKIGENFDNDLTKDDDVSKAISELG
jgi:hypothetical protein